eukprot:COSAG03_NODE_677_length_6352_cov_24.786982_6_plen_412_part_01
MIPFEQEFDNLQARVIFNANRLVLPWMLGTPMPADLPDQIIQIMGHRGHETTSGPVQVRSPSVKAPTDATAWPAELQDLVSIPAFAACLATMEVASLTDFGENVDLEEGHDEQMLAVIEALPAKPKKNRAIKVRAERCLQDLLLRFRIYDGLDKDGDCELSKEECHAAPTSVVVARAGGSLGDQFDAITGCSRLLNFADFYNHAIIVEGEGVPPQPAPAHAPAPTSDTSTVGTLASLASANSTDTSTLIALSAEELEELMKEQGLSVLARKAIATDHALQSSRAAAGPIAAAIREQFAADVAGVRITGCPKKDADGFYSVWEEHNGFPVLRIGDHSLYLYYRPRLCQWVLTNEFTLDSDLCFCKVASESGPLPCGSVSWLVGPSTLGTKGWERRTFSVTLLSSGELAAAQQA